MKLLSIKQAAEMLGYSRQYVWMLIKMKRLKGQKVGGIYVVKESEVINLLNNQIVTKSFKEQNEL